MSDSFAANDNPTVPTAPPPLPPAPPGPATTSTRSSRSPIVALLLSLFPGLGQMYNGQLIKAMVFFFAWAGCIWLTGEGDWHFGLIIPFVYLVNLVDAYRTAAYLGNRPAAAFEFDDRPESPAWGIGLVVLGVVLLLNNLGWLPLHTLGRYWPLGLIAAGGAFVWSAIRRNQER